jgi:predicted nucleic acid-binding protein
LSIYVDSSFLVSLYVTDRHSSDARSRIVNASPVALTPLHRAEWAHAVAQHIFRGQLSRSEAQLLDKQLGEDAGSGIWLVSDMPEDAFSLCADLGRRYGPKLGLRTLDSLHVACALEHKDDRFWSYDNRQLTLAKAVGLKIH